MDSGPRIEGLGILKRRCVRCRGHVQKANPDYGDNVLVKVFVYKKK